MLALHSAIAAPTATKLMLRSSHAFPFTPFLSSPRSVTNSLPRIFFWPHALSTISSAASIARVSFSPPQPVRTSPTPIVASFHGPSLRKGAFSPSPTTHRATTSTSLLNTASTTELNEGIEIDESQFTRVFEVAALRVPSDRCFVLEGRLRGHLLNWPRVRNIARVLGDKIDEDMQNLLTLRSSNNGDEAMKSLTRRLYGKAEGDGEELSSVLYRDKLAKEFNARGYTKFRNLAKISRPKRKKKRMPGEEREGGSGRRDSVVVEVVEADDGKDLGGLLGDEFKGKKWRGSTRLLLLDERLARRDVGELPEAVKAVFREGTSQTEPAAELVRCKLTLHYDYWPMDEVLESLLPEGMIVPSAFETVGHIAHLNLRDEHLPYKRIIAKVVLDKNCPKIQTVVNKIDAISSDYRTMSLEILTGNRSLVTSVIENGIRFHVDLATVYWNSRLATERQRLVSGFTCEDVVCDVFSGVGPIAIAAAKIVKRVYANDLNPYAVDYLERNSVLNRLERKIEVYNMDGRRFIDTVFASEKGHSITQIIMNLPKDAAEYLDVFRGIFRYNSREKRFKLPRIHVYGFSKADDPEFEFDQRVRVALASAEVAIDVRRVRLVAPGKWMLCASFVLPESVGYGEKCADYAS